MKAILFEAQKNTEVDSKAVCAGCGKAFVKEELTRDHELPSSLGGANNILNVILLCAPCNRLKDDMYHYEGLRRRTAKSMSEKQKRAAQKAYESAKDRAAWICEYWHTDAVQDFIRGLNL